MFIAREPVLENSFCKHDTTQNTPLNSNTPIVCQQGRVAVISGNDGETTVVKGMDSCDQVPFGFLMQEVRTQYLREYIPFGGVMDRDRGTQREFVGGPIGVAHHGIYSTNVYTIQSGDISAGDNLYATASGTLTIMSGEGYCSSGWNSSNPIAVAMNTLTPTRQAQGRYLHIKLLI